MAILDDIQSTFGEVKRVGSSGEYLVSELRQMIEHMDNVISDFETGMNSETWTTNFVTFGGSETLEWAHSVYVELKETREKLIQMGM